MTSDVSTASPSGPEGESFGTRVRQAYRSGGLVVQPRMGFSDASTMRAGLIAARAAEANVVGTLTLDSYTRVGDHDSARRALDEGRSLNGYPLVTQPKATTLALLDGVRGPDFPVQVRHGSPRPQRIIAAMSSAGLTATEGGPVSYCLPYGRVPLRESVANWKQCCELLAAGGDAVGEPHLETFGGCMLGQLCPPSLLIAVSLLEAMFFLSHGIRSVSLSYAQQTDPDQDAEAIIAMRHLAEQFVPTVDQHVVIYAYMGVYPRTAQGAQALLVEAARLATRTGSERLIVKTVAEAYRIPTIAENVQALETAAAAARDAPAIFLGANASADTGIQAETSALIDRVLNLSPDLGDALALAFERGFLDIPYCLHPDNAGRSSSRIDGSGTLQWTSTGSMPIPHARRSGGRARQTSSAELLASLGYVAQKFDNAPPGQMASAVPLTLTAPDQPQ
jgi:methylaspartate mutase epsilon subunit